MIGKHETHEEEPREQRRRVLFGIDYDKTWSADPGLFAIFVAALRGRGHDAVLVTGRSDEGQWGAEVRREVREIPIVFAANGWKREAAERAGYKVDVWIDDHPESIAKQHLLLAEQKDKASR